MKCWFWFAILWEAILYKYTSYQGTSFSHRCTLTSLQENLTLQFRKEILSVASYTFYSLNYSFHLAVSVVGSKTKDKSKTSCIIFRKSAILFLLFYCTFGNVRYPNHLQTQEWMYVNLFAQLQLYWYITETNTMFWFVFVIHRDLFCGFTQSHAHLFRTLNFHYTTDLFPNNWASKSSNVQHCSGVLNCVHSRCCKLSILTVIILHKIQRNKLSVVFPRNAMKISIW